jgi:hypothetical protein
MEATTATLITGQKSFIEQVLSLKKSNVFLLEKKQMLKITS